MLAVPVTVHDRELTMLTKAARLIEHGKPLEIEDVELSDPGTDELLVEMLFAGVNPIDRYAAIGRANADAPVPRTLGVEGVGRVDGHLVLVHGYGVAAERDGVWSQQAVVPAQAAIPVPEGVGAEEAAVMGVAGVTAWRTCTQLAQVTNNDRVLVLGAAGGVGSIIVSIAHSLGATVWGQCGSKEKGQWIGERGADNVIVADADGLGDAVGEFAPTAVFDPLGGKFTGVAIGAMSPHGRLVLFGTSADPAGELPLQSLYRKGLRVLGYAGLLESDDVMAESIGGALQALAGGRLSVEIDSVMPLDAVNDAFERLTDRSVRGNMVLDLSG
jgi:NADPH2:quinone reductase